MGVVIYRYVLRLYHRASDFFLFLQRRNENVIMKIIIAGDGETGTHLANTLSVENQDIVLMGIKNIYGF